MGALENTIISFFVDNGTKGWKTSVVRQRGMHVPMVIYALSETKFVQGSQNIISDLTDILPTLAEIMGTELPTIDNYELRGKSLWPYLTKQEEKHREWIYGYKGKNQMVRGYNLLRDENGDWWDASKTPKDLDQFQKINDFSLLSKELKNDD